MIVDPHGGLNKQPHARTSQNCLCALDLCSKLHNSHLHCGCFSFFFLCMCVCALLNCVPYLTSARGRVTLFYLPNHSVSLLDFEFRCALVTTAAQATTEVATLTDKILHAEIDRLLNFTSVERELFEPLQLYEDLGAHR